MRLAIGKDCGLLIKELGEKNIRHVYLCLLTLSLLLLISDKHAVNLIPTVCNVLGDRIRFEQEMEKQAELAAWTGAANHPISSFLVPSLFRHPVQRMA